MTVPVRIRPKARRRGRAAPGQNYYQLSCTVSSAELEGIYGFFPVKPAPRAEEAEPPTATPAPGVVFEHAVGALGAGNNVHEGNYTLAQAKAKCVEVGAVGFTHFGDSIPDEATIQYCYFKSTTTGNADPKWQKYLLRRV